MNKIDKSIRFVNFLIDLVVIVMITIVVTIVFGSLTGSEKVLIWIVTFVYYFVLESLTKQTIGKMITNTKVVMKDGTKPSVIRIFMRSFLRIVPVDALSYLFGKNNGLHDLLSGTRLARKDAEVAE
ncbi:RDD family protein [Kordia jejudonensis]|uniref:RDD family protein n=1 Tax=Kordia jejudonensis TaxID=1348245 RepID=UPI00062941B4|nr:RDD family protein [Kordia jejudonensis]